MEYILNKVGVGIPGRTRYYMMLFMAFKIVDYKAKDVFLNRFVFYKVWQQASYFRYFLNGIKFNTGKHFIA
jgi:hypothetical protein